MNEEVPLSLVVYLIEIIGLFRQTPRSVSIFAEAIKPTDNHAWKYTAGREQVVRGIGASRIRLGR